MVERTVQYNNEPARQAAIAQAESQGETMIHDDLLVAAVLDPDGNIITPSEHLLTFDTLISTPPSARFLKRKDVANKSAGGTLSNPEIQEAIDILLNGV